MSRSRDAFLSIPGNDPWDETPTGDRPMNMNQLEEVRRIIHRHLEEIEVEFAEEMKLTFIARHPTNPECWIVLTNDDLKSLATRLLEESDTPINYGGD